MTHIPWVNLSALEHYKTGTPSIILDDNGKEWARFELDHRKPVSLSDMPDHLIKAFLAAEDHDFFSHNGISPRGIIRSILINCMRKAKVQGASTITQQLVRLLFFDHRKTFTRKIKEQLLSLAVERQFTKELILETYLNHIYFGRGIYGVEAASQRFWKKPIQELTIDESAALAAIVRSPTRNCPLINPENTHSRRNLILKSMYKLTYINEATFTRLIKKPLTIHTNDDACLAPHAKEYIRLFAENLVGRNSLYCGGYIIKSTLNMEFQKQAHMTFKKHLDGLKQKFNNQVDGALITLDNEQSTIKALVGGYDFNSSQFNRALHARRQMGSILKPLIYAAYIEQGHDFDELEVDESITFDDHGVIWSPQNFNHKFEGTMTLAQALSVSKNSIAVKTLMKCGIPTLLSYLSKCHITEIPQPYPSLALGCIDAPLLEVASLYTMFVHQGIYKTPTLIEWVKNESNKKIWKAPESSEKILSWKTCGKVIKALSISFNRYKQKNPYKWNHVEVFGKTGTTNKSRTCWFTGSTPSYTTAIYIGRDDNQSLGKEVFPSQTAFPIWLDYNRLIAQPTANFEFDPSLFLHSINPFTGERVNPQSAEAITILK